MLVHLAKVQTKPTFLLVKVALYEHMAAMFGGPPNANHLALYTRWAKGQWGMIMTGNVQVMRDHLSLGRDNIVPEELTPEAVEPFTRLAAAIHQTDASTSSAVEDGAAGRTLAILQLSHAGRQSPNVIGGRWPFAPPLAPSTVPMEYPRRENREQAGLARLISNLLYMTMYKTMFQTPWAMSISNIEAAIGAFVRGAQLAARSGFDGIELHGAHGCTCTPTCSILYIMETKVERLC